MADGTDNVISPATPARPSRPGAAPLAFDVRYSTDERGGPGIGFYVDGRSTTAAFRDEGFRLTTAKPDREFIEDMVALAKYRDWKIIDVSGTEPFRRETWLAGMAAGLEVRGYRPTARDLHTLTRRVDADAHRLQHRPNGPPLDWRSQRIETADGPRLLLTAVETVVRARIVDPNHQKIVITLARNRFADWLERGERFDALERRAQARIGRERQR
jgi:hypothetical protein